MNPLLHPALDPYRERYARVEPVPFRVVFELAPGSPLVVNDPICLDNLLARSVVEEAFGSSLIPGGEGGERLERVPAPLAVLWRDGEGWPLYAMTPFEPAGSVTEDTHYVHKRSQPGRHTRAKSGTFAIRSTQGRWMERRIPVRAFVCDEWHATAAGDPREAARLLSRFSHVGRWRSAGFGQVRRFRVEPLEAGFSLTRDGRLLRPLPVEAAHLLGPLAPLDGPAPVGWTPPQWTPALFRPGWPAGTAVGRDFLEGAYGASVPAHP